MKKSCLAFAMLALSLLVAAPPVLSQEWTGPGGGFSVGPGFQLPGDQTGSLPPGSSGTTPGSGSGNSAGNGSSSGSQQNTGSAYNSQAQNSTANRGERGFTTTTTWQDDPNVRPTHDNAGVMDRYAPSGYGASQAEQTKSTRTRDYLQQSRQGALGSQGLDRAGTELLAPNSVDTRPFPSGSFNLGFFGAPQHMYGGPWASNTNSSLPQTSTGSVDLDITNGYF
jgi:hypothetical protein